MSGILSGICQESKCQGYSEYLKGLCGDFADNPKRFWSFVKCFKQSKALSILKHGGVQVADDISKANTEIITNVRHLPRYSGSDQAPCHHVSIFTSRCSLSVKTYMYISLDLMYAYVFIVYMRF